MEEPERGRPETRNGARRENGEGTDQSDRSGSPVGRLYPQQQRRGGGVRGREYRRGRHQDARPTGSGNLTLAVWNVNGWTLENEKLREQIILSQNIDIFCVVETHFYNHRCEIRIPGYTAFHHNRQAKHKRAVRGSGGVAILINDSTMNEYKLRLADTLYEGILGVEFTHKISEFKFLIYVCYLPPENCSGGKMQTHSMPI